MEVGGFHAWTLRLEWSDGQPVFPAQIGVNGGMPEHGHGLPSQPVVTEYLGDGKYLVEGVSFNMMGKWRVLFEVTATEHKDRLQFELLLDW